jgi:hypothetical protein
MMILQRERRIPNHGITSNDLDHLVYPAQMEILYFMNVHTCSIEVIAVTEFVIMGCLCYKMKLIMTDSRTHNKLRQRASCLRECTGCIRQGLL